jgi:hypothetical protein
VTIVRADCEFAIAFRVPPPVPVSPPSPPSRRLKRRCGCRHFFYGRRVDRSSIRTRSTRNRKSSRQAEKDECVAHECSPRLFPCRQRQRFRCYSEAHVYVSSMAGRAGALSTTHSSSQTVKSKCGERRHKWPRVRRKAPSADFLRFTGS